MNKEAIRQWVETLRSVKYKQGRGVLRRGDEFCCLGVACDILRDELGLHWREGQLSMAITASDGQWEHIYLPHQVAEYLFGDGKLTNPEVGAISLSGLNDGGATFSQIADAIEATFLTDEVKAR